MSQKPVLIAGAGISALLLAQSLHRSKIPFQIFERDESLVFRGQGYRLRLSDAGLGAIEAALGPEKWTSFYERCSKTGGSGFIAFNALTGERADELLVGETLNSSKENKVVGCARGEMRSMFIEGIEEYVHFGKYVRGYELVDDGVRLVFADGSKSDVGCLVIGGEGIKSSIAKQVSNGLLKVYDTGARGIHGQAPTSAFKKLGEGVFRISQYTDKGPIGIMTNVRPNDLDNPDVQFGWTMGGPPGSIVAPNDDYAIVGKQAADIAKALTKDWHEDYQPLFEQMNEAEAAFWKITCSTPSGVPVWPNQPRVTVIGDAVHSMTPAGGIGCNTAVQDSALLGKLLHDAGGWKEGITEEYEKKMRVYGSAAVNTSYTFATKMMGIRIEEGVTPTIGTH